MGRLTRGHLRRPLLEELAVDATRASVHIRRDVLCDDLAGRHIPFARWMADRCPVRWLPNYFTRAVLRPTQRVEERR